MHEKEILELEDKAACGYLTVRTRDTAIALMRAAETWASSEDMLKAEVGRLRNELVLRESELQLLRTENVRWRRAAAPKGEAAEREYCACEASTYYAHDYGGRAPLTQLLLRERAAARAEVQRVFDTDHELLMGVVHKLEAQLEAAHRREARYQEEAVELRRLISEQEEALGWRK